MSEYVREVNESDFDRVVLQSKMPVLVDFWGSGAGHAVRLRQSLSLSPSTMRALRTYSS